MKGTQNLDLLYINQNIPHLSSDSDEHHFCTYNQDLYSLERSVQCMAGLINHTVRSVRVYHYRTEIDILTDD